MAATGVPAQAALASWEGLLRHGLDHCVRFGGKSEAWAAALHARLVPPRTKALLAVAGEVCGARTHLGSASLGGG